MHKSGFPLCDSKVINDSPANPFYVSQPLPNAVALEPADEQPPLSSTATIDPVDQCETTAATVTVAANQPQRHPPASEVFHSAVSHQADYRRSGSESGSISGYTTVSETFVSGTHTVDDNTDTHSDKPVLDVTSGPQPDSNINPDPPASSTTRSHPTRLVFSAPLANIVVPIVPTGRWWPPVTQSPGNPFDVTCSDHDKNIPVGTSEVATSHLPPAVPTSPPMDPTAITSAAYFEFERSDDLTVSQRPDDLDLATDPTQLPSQIEDYKSAVIEPSLPPMSDTFEQEYAITAAREHAQDIFHKPDPLVDTDPTMPCPLSIPSEITAIDSERNTQETTLGDSHKARAIVSGPEMTSTAACAPLPDGTLPSLDCNTSQLTGSTAVPSQRSTEFPSPQAVPPTDTTHAGGGGMWNVNGLAKLLPKRLLCTLSLFDNQPFPTIVEDADNNPFWVSSQTSTVVSNHS
ncbi:hypothetical protein IWQ62_000994 [Dispira parvispora]|uniref:Uncharacterized protein n=1 Tax=Dispira parvispora TaxID=1520584 RepID=A0A9W8AW03_9FUNG|nr:hypothetical protein IWQ62_000994 [Dispira parvispora]